MENNKRLIDANEVYELHSNYPMFARSRADLTDLRDILDEATTVDAVEVVRCKDCIKTESHGADHEVFCTLIGAYMGNNDYCSYGERKADE